MYSLPGVASSAREIAPAVSTPGCSTTEFTMRMFRPSHAGPVADTAPREVCTVPTNRPSPPRFPPDPGVAFAGGACPSSLQTVRDDLTVSGTASASSRSGL